MHASARASLQVSSQAPLHAQVLIVEDEPEHAEVMADALRKPGHVCTLVSSVEAALDELRFGAFDVIVTDLRMPASGGFAPPKDLASAPLPARSVASDGADAGLFVLALAKALQPQTETVLVTAHGDVPTARAAFKLGAYDFIEKPLDLEVFRNLIGRAAETVLLRHQNVRLREQVDQAGFEGVVAASEPMRRVLRQVRLIAPSTIPVLITGESGTGKEVIAAALHRVSRRSGNRYVTFNCAGQSESLLEDQLFGHVKGAFTGADKERQGVFEYADGGTLFLDEIGDMPLTMQAKLLRVLESGEVVRLGSNEARKADVRFVSATNRDLREMVKAGTFREDLYFRINGSSIHLAPLRERKEDIPALVAMAVERFAHELAPAKPTAKPTAKPPAKSPVTIPAVSDAALMRLTSYAWPGNVRQLLNVVQNMVVLALADEPAPGQRLTISPRHIPDEVREATDASAGDDEGTDSAHSLDAGEGASSTQDTTPTFPASTLSGSSLAGTSPAGTSLAGTSLQQIEKRAIRDTLRMTGGNREQAAKLLGIGERTLYRKLREYGLR